MKDRQALIEEVEGFYVDLIEPYKDLERLVAGESRILTIFRKVDYQARISKFKALKKKAQGINLKKIEWNGNDELAVQVKEKLGICISRFVSLIDAQVSCQTFLLKKSQGEKLSNIDYQKAVYRVRRMTEELQDGLRSLDADYANLEEYE